MTTAVEMMQGGISAGAARAINGFQSLTMSGAGSTISDATPIIASHSVFTTVASGTGAILSNTEIGDEYYIYNSTGTNALTIYPPTTSARINQLAVGVGMQLSPYTAVKLKKASATAWTGMLSA